MWFYLGVFVGAPVGVILACAFAARKVVEAEAEAARWREACERAYVSGWVTRGQEARR